MKSKKKGVDIADIDMNIITLPHHNTVQKTNQDKQGQLKKSLSLI